MGWIGSGSVSRGDQKYEQVGKQTVFWMVLGIAAIRKIRGYHVSLFLE